MRPKKYSTFQTLGPCSKNPGCVCPMTEGAVLINHILYVSTQSLVSSNRNRDSRHFLLFFKMFHGCEGRVDKACSESFRSLGRALDKMGNVITYVPTSSLTNRVGLSSLTLERMLLTRVMLISHL